MSILIGQQGVREDFKKKLQKEGLWSKRGGCQKKIKLGTVDIKVTLGGEEFFSRSFPSQYFPTFKFIPLHFELKIHRFFLNLLT